ncbi:YesL family protein [Virgibacillus siamensis]|uniref:YesL family protein n=1 Tax=Virgibacillus siamensis TaxID=480071 RepID=UPI0009854582|nr:YesL family protein [Virgibacillus siamensis]
MNSTSTFIFNVMEWITRFAYVNLLWITFTLTGGVIFGVFPATTAMFAVIRKWLTGNTEIPVFKTFWNYFKHDFVKSNILGVFIIGIAVLIGLDFVFMQVNVNDLLRLMYLPLSVFMFLFLLFLFYIFPAFVHYDLKLGKIIRNTFLIMLISPLHSLLIFICLVSICFIMAELPALAFIFGASTYAFITMWLCLNAFTKIEKKAENTNSKNAAR